MVTTAELDRRGLRYFVPVIAGVSASDKAILDRNGLRYAVQVDADILPADRTVLEQQGLSYFVEVDSSGNSVAPGGGVVGGAALLTDETNGFATDCTYATDVNRVAVKTAGVVVESATVDFFTNNGASPKLTFNSAGMLAWEPHNLFLNSASPATQSVTLIVGESYTVTVVGSGSMTGSAGASGVATQASPLTFVATTTSGTFTLAGSLTRIQINRGTTATAYLATTAARRYGFAFDYNPATLVSQGLQSEAATTNFALWSSDFTNAAWVKSNMTTAFTASGPMGAANSASTLTATAANATALQTITSASASRISSVFLKRRTGTGNIDVTQDNGTTWATQAITSSWARYALAEATVTNPVVGIRIATSGDAVDAAIFMLENSANTRAVTTAYPTWTVSQAKTSDGIQFPLSLIPALGSEYSIYVRFALPHSSNTRYPIILSNGTVAEFAGIKSSGTGNLSMNVTVGSVAVGTVAALGVVTSNAIISVAMRFKLNDLALSVNGGAPAFDTTSTLPTVTDVRFGNSGTGTATLEMCRIYKAVIVPRAWSDAELMTKSAT